MSGKDGLNRIGGITLNLRKSSKNKDMGTVLDGLSKIFKHLGRDVMIYMIPGLVVLLDLAYLDYLYDTQVYENLKDVPCRWAIFIGVLYLLGQCCMALCTCVSCLKGGFLIGRRKDRLLLKKEIKVFKKNTRFYEQYIERYDNLWHFRLNLKYAFLLAVIINVLAMSIASLINGLDPLPIITCVLAFLYGLFCMASKRAKKSFEDRLKVLAGNFVDKQN